ncbi:MAG TPA: carboxynorspermidine decarboxylase [Oscillospiraceae bacterium]|nr:carboxynorspermidine decarboxylase [Oscillospiraceae bacterium]HPV99611.1 carboxynorspermidine decarboxylase [Oscillospiraceae bacterium]
MKNYSELFKNLPTPCFVLDEEMLVRNLELCRRIEEESGCKILLAQKAFSMYRVYGLMARYLSGTAASSLFEAKLAAEHFPGEVHIYAPAYREEEFGEILGCCSHIVFNSYAQLEKFLPEIRASKKKIEYGLRINPQVSTCPNPMYDPCAPGSRFGIPAERFDKTVRADGLHFHTLCEQGVGDLKKTLAKVEEDFGDYLRGMKWVNFGGGHFLTAEDYDTRELIRVIRDFSEKYGVQVYLEPGEAVAYNAGFLISRVMDVVQNGMDIAILDASAACHMPQVLEEHYLPEVLGAGAPGEYPYACRLAGNTCLGGDVIGDYSFPRELRPGDLLIFADMAHYTMVKTNFFNGVNLPSIAKLDRDGTTEVLNTFGYEDFKSKL